jgi:hypothetical protein
MEAWKTTLPPPPLPDPTNLWRKRRFVAAAAQLWLQSGSVRRTPLRAPNLPSPPAPLSRRSSSVDAERCVMQFGAVFAARSATANRFQSGVPASVLSSVCLSVSRSVLTVFVPRLATEVRRRPEHVMRCRCGGARNAENQPATVFRQVDETWPSPPTGAGRRRQQRQRRWQQQAAAAAVQFVVLAPASVDPRLDR